MFTYLNDDEPFCFEKGEWDGLRSELLLIKTRQGKFHIARNYKGVHNNYHFSDFIEEYSDLDIIDVEQWVTIASIEWNI